jgi:small-conductance mechanosensitive channel
MRRLSMLFLQIPSTSTLLDRLSATRVVETVVILSVAYVLVRLATSFLERLGDRVPRSRFIFKMVASIIRFSVWIIALALTLLLFTPSKETFLAVIASVGLALGLGAQDLVKSIIGGLVILVDRPYQLGDRVKIGDAYGEIDHIGLRSTKMMTFDDTRVTIPNSAILDGMAWNSNAGVPHQQSVTDLFLPHYTNPALAQEIAYEAVYSSPYLMLEKPVTILVQDRWELGPFLQVRIRAYVYDHRYEQKFQSDVTLRAKEAFFSRGMGWKDSIEEPRSGDSL